MESLRILNVCAEFVPLAKAGGLGDVTHGLAQYLAGVGHDVVTVLPRYRSIPPPPAKQAAVARPGEVEYDGEAFEYSIYANETVPDVGRVYVVDCPELLGDDIYASGEREAHRFLLLCRAALDLCRALQWAPQIAHCHDWHTALLPAMLRDAARTDTLFADVSTVLTIHNIGYQGLIPARVLREAGLKALLPLTDAEDLARDEVNLLKTGILNADAVTTVSPTHAAEIQTPAYGMGLDGLLRQRGHRLQGILNGVDYSLWSPDTDTLIEANYSADKPADKLLNKAALLEETSLDLPAGRPLVGMVSRLVQQKGVDLLVDVLPGLLDEGQLGCVVLGTGEPTYTDELRVLAGAWPARLAFIEAYDDRMAHRILAGSDMLVIPSRYEPCGLTQLYALRYGTVPIVRRTGGLADSIRHFDPGTGAGNGVLFEHADALGLAWGLATGLEWYREPETWKRLVQNGMREDFSWQQRASEYEALFMKLAGVP